MVSLPDHGALCAGCGGRSRPCGPPFARFFYAQYNAFYEADRYVDGDGNKRLTVESEGGELKLDTDVDVMAIAPVFLWATSAQWLGADYALLVAPNLGKSSVAAELSVLDQGGTIDDSSIGIGDTFVQPLWLTWRGAQSDVSLVRAFMCQPVNTMQRMVTQSEWVFGLGRFKVLPIGLWMKPGVQRWSLG